MVKYNPRNSGTTKTQKLRPVGKDFDDKIDKLFGVKCPKCKGKVINGSCKCEETPKR